jgi:NitT/TauT family transport system substrate-binding protein
MKMAISGHVKILLASALVVFSTAATAAQSPAQKTKQIIIAEIARNLIFAPLYVARARGLFAAEGLDVTIRPMWSPEQVLNWYDSGKAQIIVQGVETALFIRQGAAGPKAKIFASLVSTAPMVLISRRQIAPGKFNWAMLRGKTVIGREPGRSTGYFFERALRNHGLDPKTDVTYVTDISVPDQVAAWKRGVGDFIVAMEPAPQTFAAEGLGYVVASVGREVGQVDFTVLIASEDYISENREAIQKITNALLRALRWMETASSAAIADAVAPSIDVLGPETLRAGIQRYRELGIWKNAPSVDQRSVAEVQTMLIESGVMRSRERIAYETLVDPRFVQRARETIK